MRRFADPYFGLSVSRVDPLPHQLEAVYDHLLKLVGVRFLLADDAGAGRRRARLPVGGAGRVAGDDAATRLVPQDGERARQAAEAAASAGEAGAARDWVSMNFRRRILLVVFQTRSVLIGYSRRIESKSRQICSSRHTRGRWMFGSQKPCKQLTDPIRFQSDRSGT